MSRSQDVYIRVVPLRTQIFSTPIIETLSNKSNNQKNQLSGEKSQITPNTNSDIFQPSENDLILN